LAGNISNFRVVNGTALYTANFTPPVPPLTNITNTALLTLQSATIVDNSSNNISITNNGTVTPAVNPVLTSTFAGTIKTPYVEYLVVGGGGAGGNRDDNNGAGGGGAGGVLTGLLPVTTGTSYTVTVGGGGAAVTSATTSDGANGVNSVLGSLIAVGGGGGGKYNSAVQSPSGGSGGGSGRVGTNLSGGNGVFGQGNAGGLATSAYSAGGGGAGTIGLGATTAVAGNGGAGIASAISGTVAVYGGGGGGAGDSVTTYGAGGVGGGGRGAAYNNSAGVSGTANTGGGGGGGTGATYTPGSGGSGIVIVSYPDIYAPLTTGGATSPTVSTSGSGSIFCNGSSYFSYNAQTPFAFGSGDFTIEFWIYYTSTPDVILDWRQSGGGVTPVPTIYYSGSALRYFVGTDQIVGSSLSSSTWYHVAICKISNVTKMYINGTQSGSNYSDTNTYLVGSGRPIIAGNGSSPGSAGSYYLSNIRLVKGVGVYTGAFTPSTAPLTATQPAGPSGSNIAAITSTATSLLLNSNSGSFLADSSTNSYAATLVTGTPAWNQASPFATGLGYKNRVYTWTSSGSITF
jgi:hypothetical protein